MQPQSLRTLVYLSSYCPQGPAAAPQDFREDIPSHTWRFWELKLGPWPAKHTPYHNLSAQSHSLSRLSGGVATAEGRDKPPLPICCNPGNNSPLTAINLRKTRCNYMLNVICSLTLRLPFICSLGC